MYTCLFRNIFERIQMDGAFDWVSTQTMDVKFSSGYPSDKAPTILARTEEVQIERGFNLTLTCAFSAGYIVFHFRYFHSTATFKLASNKVQVSPCLQLEWHQLSATVLCQMGAPGTATIISCPALVNAWRCHTVLGISATHGLRAIQMHSVRRQPRAEE